MASTKILESTSISGKYSVNENLLIFVIFYFSSRVQQQALTLLLLDKWQ